MEKVSIHELRELELEAKKAILAADTSEKLETLRIRCLGRKSPLSQFLRQLSHLKLEEKRSLGSSANKVRNSLEELLEKRFKELAGAHLKSESRAGSSSFDITLPGYPLASGGKHPLTLVTERILEVFKVLGFSYVETAEVETEPNNFTFLNIPEDHPARDMHDTLYLKRAEKKENSQTLLLRTHTTPAQIHVMQASPPPYRVVTAGKVFRREAVDATHLPVFNQIDAFHVDANCSMADLKSTLEIWASKLFGPKAQIRFRPSYFPFTEPSCEVEVACFICKGSGCGTCKNGWIEMLGAGMIHPHVLARQGHDPKQWKGFAFGLGVERVAMVLWGIPDIRFFYENDIHFLKQFMQTPLLD